MFLLLVPALILGIGMWTPFIRMNAAFDAVWQRGGISEIYKPVQAMDLRTHDFIMNVRIRTHHYARPLDDAFYRWFAPASPP